MKNKSKKANKTKPRPKKGKSKNKQSSGMRLQPSNLPNGIIEKVCSNYDPFCQAAQGGKLFDENTAPSLTYNNRQIFAVTTDAAGEYLAWFNNTPTRWFNTATIVAGAVTAWTSLDSNFYTNIGTAGISKWRVVSTGLRFFTTQSWTTATGYMNITEASEYLQLPPTVGFVAGSLRLGPRSKTLAIRDANCTVIGRSKGMVSRTYKDAPEADSGYTGSILYFNGVPSTTIGYLEVVTNFEWIADPGSNYQFFASPAAPHSRTVLDSVTKLATDTNNIKTLSDGIDNAHSFMKDAKNAVSKTVGLIEDAAAIGGMIYPPLRGFTKGMKLIGN
jgi:hypothetical protein